MTPTPYQQALVSVHYCSVEIWIIQKKYSATKRSLLNDTAVGDYYIVTISS